MTDSYVLISINGIERQTRGTANAHLITDPQTKVPRNWKEFMSSAANKQQLVRFLQKKWKKDENAPRLFGREVLFVCDERCVRLLQMWTS